MFAGEVQLILYAFLIIVGGGGLLLWLRLPRGSKRGGVLPHCEVCGRTLSFRRMRECRRARDLVYPFKNISGERVEVEVRWLCGGCMERAKRYRAGQAIPDEPSGART